MHMSRQGSCELCPCRLNAGLQVCPLNSPTACVHWRHMRPYALMDTFYTIAVFQLGRGTRHVLIPWCSKFVSRTWVVLSQITYRRFAPTASGNVFLEHHFFVQDTYLRQHTSMRCTLVGALIWTWVVLATSHSPEVTTAL